MESGINKKKIKVVWLCQFANLELINRYNSNVNEFAPWIDQLIQLFENCNEFEIHIVAPNVYQNNNDFFQLRGINYWLFDRTIPFVPRKVDSFLRLNHIIDYYFNKRRVREVVKKISPDIIHLHGAENAYYSATVLQLIDKYPTLVTIQGFIRNSSPYKFDFLRRKYIRTELQILTRAINFGIRAEFMRNFISELNPRAHFHWHNYPINWPTIQKDIGIKDEFDCVFFSRVHKDKGIEDLLYAIALIKRTRPTVSIVVIGPVVPNYLLRLKQLVLSLNIVDNVVFKGFLKSQEEIFRIAVTSKISVLPTYHDIIPGTVIESMLMKIPVIAYSVGGLPDINNDGFENIVLVEPNNIVSLSEKINQLLSDFDLRSNIGLRGFNRASILYSNDKVVDSLRSIYNSFPRFDV